MTEQRNDNFVNSSEDNLSLKNAGWFFKGKQIKFSGKNYFKKNPLSQLLEYSFDYWIIWDRDFNELSSRDIENKQNFSRKSKISDRIVEVSLKHIPNLTDSWRKSAQLAFENGKTAILHNKFLQDNRWIYSTTDIIPLQNEVKEIIAVAAIYSDISDENSFLEKNQFNDQILDNYLYPLLIIDQESRVSYVNESILKLWRFKSKSDIIGKRFNSLFENEIEANQFIQVLNTEGFYSNELSAKSSDNFIFMVKPVAHRFDKNEKHNKHAIITFTDNTEKKQIEESYRDLGQKLMATEQIKSDLEFKLQNIERNYQEAQKLVDTAKKDRASKEKEFESLFTIMKTILSSIKHATFLTDINGIIQHWNDDALGYFKFTEAQIKDRAIHDVLPEIIKAPLSEIFKMKESRTSKVQSTKEIIEKQWHCIINEILSDKNKVIGFIIVIRDTEEWQRTVDILNTQREIFSNTSDPSIFGDIKTHKIEDMNKSAQYLLSVEESKIDSYKIEDLFDAKLSEKIIKQLSENDFIESKMDHCGLIAKTGNLPTDSSISIKSLAVNNDKKYLINISFNSPGGGIPFAAKLYDECLGDDNLSFIAFDLNGRLFFTSNAFLAQWGYQSEFELIGKPISSLIPEPDIINRIEKNEDKSDLLKTELKIKKKGASDYQYFDASFKLLRNSENEPLFRTGSFKDLTKERTDSEKIDELIAELDKHKSRNINETKRNILSDIPALGVAVLNEANLIIEANDVFCRFLNVEMAKILNKPFTAAFDVAIQEQIEKTLSQLPPGKTFTKDISLNNGDTNNKKYISLSVKKTVSEENSNNRTIIVLEDITASKRLENNLTYLKEKNEEDIKSLKDQIETLNNRYETIVNHAEIGYIRTDINYQKLIDSNRFALQKLGFTLEKIQNGKIHEQQLPEDFKAAIINALKKLNGDKKDITNFKAAVNDNFNLKATVKSNSSENALDIFFTDTTNETYLQNSVTSLKAQLNQQKKILEDSEGIIMLLDKDGLITFASRKACKISGKEESELYGQNWFDLFAPYKLRKNLLDNYLKSIESIKNENLKPYSLDLQFGKQNIFRWNFAILSDPRNASITTAVNGIDISDLKGIENRKSLFYEIEKVNTKRNMKAVLSEISSSIQEILNIDIAGFHIIKEKVPIEISLDLLPINIGAKEYVSFLINKDGKPVSRDNDPFIKEILGILIEYFDDFDFPIFSTSRGSIWLDSTDRLNEILAEKNKKEPSREISHNYESIAIIPIKHKDEILGYLHLQDGHKAVFTKDDILFFEKFCSAFAAKLSSEANTSDSLTKMEEQVREKDREFIELLNIITTDFKSAVISTRTFAHIIENDLRLGDVTKIEKDIKLISKSLDNINDFIDDISMLTASNRLLSYSQEIRVEKIVKEAANLLSSKIEERQVEVIVAPNLPKTSGNRLDILYIIQNIMDNAIKFMGDQKKPRIEIGIVRKRNEDILYIRDNGIGIETKDQRKIFNLFEKLNHQTPGSGFGLTLVKSIIESYNGKIWVDSDGIGTGSTFYFTLPKTE